MTVLALVAALLFPHEDMNVGGSPTNASNPAPAAAEAAPGPQDLQLPPGATVRVRKRPAESPYPDVEAKLAQPGDTVDANDLVDEMLDGVAADIARLGGARIGPILLERIRLSDNLSPDFAPVLEARLVAALARATDVAIVRCNECWATRGRLERGAWVVSRGVNGREELASVAGKYAAKTLLTVAMTWQERPSSLAMDVELVRADDSSIAFAEQYRMTPDTTLLYRGADRAQQRAERLKEVQDRLESRPRFGYAVEAGTMLMGSSAGSFWGLVGRYQINERFGADGPFEAGLSLGGFVNTGTFALALIGATVSARVSSSQLLASEWRVVANTGTVLMAGANSFYGGAGIRFKPAVRFTLHANLNYIAPFQVRGTGPQFGNFCPEVGLGFSWP